MAVDKKISQLTSLAQVDVSASTDVLPIVDTSATETKKITVSALVGAGATAGISGAVRGFARRNGCLLTLPPPLVCGT